jgi:hypothetical protein
MRGRSRLTIATENPRPADTNATMHSANWLWTLSAVWLVACGHAHEDKDEADAPVELAPGELACGNSACSLPEGVTGVGLCCANPFTGTCGVKTPHREACRPFPQLDARCPVPSAFHPERSGMFMDTPAAFGCCTSRNECGVDVVADYDVTLSRVGTAGLVDSRTMGESCVPRRSLCNLFFEAVDSPEAVLPQTCDGQPLEPNFNCTFGALPDP